MDLIPEEVLSKIFLHLDEDSKLIVGLVCKYYYYFLKNNNNNKKLKCSLKYLNSSYSLSYYCHKFYDKEVNCLNSINYEFKKIGNYKECGMMAKRGCLFCLLDARNKGCNWDSNVLYLAANHNNLNIIKYFHKNKILEFNNNIAHHASYGGSLEVLNYFHKKKLNLDWKNSMLAAEKGHLEILKYLHRNNYDLDIEIFKYAAKNGHLNCLKFLITIKKIKKIKKYIQIAIENNHTDIIDYLLDRQKKTIYFKLLKAHRY